MKNNCTISTMELAWKDVIGEEKHKEYFQTLLNFIAQERERGVVIYPEQHDVFNAFKFTPFSAVKVVMLGQDPYHGPGQAHGLCFSVKHGAAIPPSLRNIFLELSTDIPNFVIPDHGCLEAWAKQGVLLLNTVLTVEAGKPQSHAGLGWEIFTDAVIRVLNEKKEKLVFLLWGNPAQKKASLIDESRHYILRAAHPSPLSAARGFLGCKHFSKTNQILIDNGRTPIDWQL